MDAIWFKVIISIIPIVFAITLHEFAHGWMAKRYGDNTAYSQGRVTLNPMSHIDPIGTVLVPLVFLLTTGLIFGWAKPVPVRFGNLYNPKKDGIKVALAGPGANLLMVIGWSLIMALFVAVGQITELPLADGMIKMSEIGISINAVLMVFNLLPIPPLDGGRVLQLLLPLKYSLKLNIIEEYGMWIILALSFTGILSYLISPIINYITFFAAFPSGFIYLLFIN